MNIHILWHYMVQLRRFYVRGVSKISHRINFLSFPLPFLPAATLVMSSSSDNECTFWSAVEILISFDRIVTCDNVTMGDKCDLMWPNVTISDKCDHMWQVGTPMRSVTACDRCAHMWQVWPQFGHVDIMDIWTSRIFGYHKVIRSMISNF